MNKLMGYRKWTVIMSVVVISTTLLGYNRITGSEWIILLQVILPSFFAANLVERLKGDK